MISEQYQQSLRNLGSAFADNNEAKLRTEKDDPAFSSIIGEREFCLKAKVDELCRLTERYLEGSISEHRLTYALSLVLDSARWSVECSVRYKKTLEAEAQSGAKVRA